MSTVSALKGLLADVRSDPELVNLPDSASLVDDVQLDSLELLSFMLAIESKLAIRIDFERLNYDHLGSLVELAAFLDAP